MGHHRAERRGRRRTTSGPRTSNRREPYSGKRVASRPDEPEVLADHTETTAQPTARTTAQPTAQPSAPELALFAELDTPTQETPAVRAGATAEIPASGSIAGRRRAIKHAGRRGPLFKVLPSPPALVGVAALALAVGGSLTTAAPDLAGHGDQTVHAASALGGDSGSGRVAGMGDRRTVNRDSDRGALEQANGTALADAAEDQARERNAALSQLAAQAQAQADIIAENRWVAPLDPVVLTARFGDYGLWASYHTGLDFNGNDGDPITNVANGVVTDAGYDGAYGNKTVVTLEDGTEIWYCHQTTIDVSVGDTVLSGQTIGTVGSTGNVTGSHLHVEVRPGGGDPVDPYAAFAVHGVDLGG
jgi:murein DD-endopeptidase MepM/ murein hydrolase activator NlpD